MADKLRPDELAAFKAAFDMFDKNQDGTISTKVKYRKIPYITRGLYAICIFFPKICGLLKKRGLYVLEFFKHSNSKQKFPDFNQK